MRVQGKQAVSPLKRTVVTAGVSIAVLAGASGWARTSVPQQVAEPPKPPAQAAPPQAPFPSPKPDRKVPYHIHKRLAERTQIVLLGTGTPIPEPENFGSATAIVVDKVPYLVDFGVGAVRRIRAVREAGVKGLMMTRVTRVFCTHLHSDHTLGLGDLIVTPWKAGRAEPLVLYGPEGLAEMASHVLKAYEKSIQHSRSLPVSPDPRGLEVDVRLVRPGVIYGDERITVRAFPVTHGDWPEAYGFRIDTPDLRIVCSGDTSPCERLVEEARGCDVLIHEAYCEKNFATLDPDTRAYYAAFHTSSSELARIAQEVKPGLLIVVHQMHFASGPSDMLKEIRRGYKGKVVYGRDMDIF